MTDDPNRQADAAADAIPGDDPSIAHDPLAEAEAAGQQPESDPTPDTGAAAQTPQGEGGPEGQEGSPEAEAPDPAGIEPGETQSVPTLRGPGPDDDQGDAQA